ncbi:MAG: hypothetical protein J6B39_01910 [Lachnospiraceae bacterium]|nr:hypothetical protein [Lachnospiraceae bacterium]
MKKRQLILDFTSLLDVIMILLFVVISNMSIASLKVNEEASQSAMEAGAQIDRLTGEKEDLLLQLETLEKQGEEYEQAYMEAASSLKELEGAYTKLQEDYDYLKIVTDYDPDNTLVYEEALKRMAKIVLICETGIDTATGNPFVEVKIYRSGAGAVDVQQAYAESFKIVHDFSLTKDERIKFNAEQVIAVTKALSGVLRDEVNNIIWFSVQYEYDDENFSNTDLEIISKAVENLERSFAKSCYVEEVKLY